MMPKFSLYGENNPELEDMIQPKLELRRWDALTFSEKMTAWREMNHGNWIQHHSEKVLETIEYLNYTFLRTLPGQKLHETPKSLRSRGGGYYSNKTNMISAARADFENIFIGNNPDELVFRMLTFFSKSLINDDSYHNVELEKNTSKRKKLVEESFGIFDKFADCINHIFEQFAVNARLTRNGMVSVQDEKIIEEIYVPVLSVLSDPKWKSINLDLSSMFDNHRQEKYPETITDAHRAVQGFLRELLKGEGRGTKGEFGKLFSQYINEHYPDDNATKRFLHNIKSYFSDLRANESTSKPQNQEATLEDALLCMNMTMVFMQHCLIV
jgi:hypothetical protein